MKKYAVVLGVGLYLLALRLLVFGSGGTGVDGASMLDLVATDVSLAPGVGQLLLSSLSFELLALVIFSALAGWSQPTRWISRVGLLALLWLNLAGSVTFLVLRTYVKGFQFVGLPAREAVAMVVGFLSPVTVTALGVGLGLAFAFGREGALERSRPPRRTLVLLSVLTLACVVAVGRLIWRPTVVPTLAHSPVTLLAASSMPLSLGAVPSGTPTPEDWEPAEKLDARWSHLANIERRFNIVMVVLESVRADVFWPSPKAPKMPNLERRAAQSAVFTRAYAHEPLTMRGIEALLFGVYPAPYWETTAGRWPKIALETVGERWHRLSLSTAFISHGGIPFAGERGFLKSRGFSSVWETNELAALDEDVSDQTLVRALEKHIDASAGRGFAALLWPYSTHLPYTLPKSRPTSHAPSSFGAYRDAVAYLDDVLGDLFNLLERKGLSEQTVVLLVADHGESFAEHPEAGQAHGDRLFETSVHIPLVLFNPVLFRGERDDRLVQQKDVAPTLTWLAGDSSSQLNLGSSIFHRRNSEAVYLVSLLDVSSLRGAMVSGSLKYMYTGPVGDSPPDERLYDVVADPDETVNLLGQQPAKAQALRSRYFGWLSHWNSRWMALEREKQLDSAEALQRWLWKKP